MWNGSVYTNLSLQSLKTPNLQQLKKMEKHNWLIVLLQQRTIYLFYDSNNNSVISSLISQVIANKTIFLLEFFLPSCFNPFRCVVIVLLLQSQCSQHHQKRKPDHRKVATSQTSELVGKAPKTCNSYPDVTFKWHH